MNRQSLQDKLIRAGVDPSLYSLDGPASDSESYSLVSDGPTWKVLYKERGQFTEIRGGLTESQGCLLIYQLLEHALGCSSQAQDTMQRSLISRALRSDITVCIEVVLALPLITFVQLMALIVVPALISSPLAVPSLTALSLAGFWAVPALWRALFAALARKRAPIWAWLGVAVGIVNTIHVYVNWPGAAHPSFVIGCFAGIHWLWLSCSTANVPGPNNSFKPKPLRGSA